MLLQALNFIAFLSAAIGASFLWFLAMGSSFASTILYLLLVLLVSGAIRIVWTDARPTQVPQDATVIDRPARKAAAGLIRRLRDGEITNDEFQEGWPKDSADRLLSALSDRIWPFYDDMHEHKLTGRYALTAAESEAFTRYALFADGDLPYEWPDFAKQNGLGYWWLFAGSAGWLVALHQFGWRAVAAAIGGLFLLHLLIRRQQAEAQARIEKSGDFDVWPFFRSADHEAAKEAA